MSFPEFLEMCGRVAHHRFKDDENVSSLDLSQKLEFVLDEVLGTIFVKRKDPVIIV